MSSSPVSTRLPADTASAGKARRFVEEILAGWDRDDFAPVATLLVSELVANAVLHARTDLEVVLRLAAERVRVEVHDQSTRLPSRKRYSNVATTGRGLLLVDKMATDWGVDAVGAGKSVWFELAAGPPADPLAAFAFDVDDDWGVDEPPVEAAETDPVAPRQGGPRGGPGGTARGQLARVASR